MSFKIKVIKKNFKATNLNFLNSLNKFNIIDITIDI